MTSGKKHNLIGLLIVLAAFVLSRLAYNRAGFTFDAVYIGGWHVIDLELLKTDLWRSLFYLHSQPPLWNLFLGLGLQAFPAGYVSFFHLIYYLLGITLAAAFYQLGLMLRFPRWLAVLSAIWLIISPAMALFEHWLGYAYLLLVMLSLSAIALYRFVETGKMVWGIMFFSLLALVTMTWSLFHLIWFLGSAIFLYCVWRDGKKILLAALIPFLLVTSWYAKNWIIVGNFGASSWAGMNLSRVITFRVLESERGQMVKAGELSPFALIPPFRNPKVYLKLLPDTPKTGIPILDEPETSLGRRNHHHLVYVDASRYYLKDALKLILHKPGVYARAVLQAGYIYFHSASDFEYLEMNRARINAFDQIWNRLFYGQWLSGETAGERLNSISPAHIGWSIFFAFIVGTFGNLRFLHVNRADLANPAMVLLLYMLFTLLFVTVIGITMEIGENNRFRFIVDPFLLLLFVFALYKTSGARR